MSDSILTSTKKALDVPENYDVFDGSIIMHINSVFSNLTQLGVGPVDGYQIADAEPTWSDYLGDNPKLNFVKTYMALRVRLLFDPPATSYLQTSFKEQIAELEWRILSEEETSATLLLGAKKRLTGNFGDEHSITLRNPTGQTFINASGTYEATFTARGSERTVPVSLDTSQKADGILILSATIRNGVYTIRKTNPARTLLTLEVNGR